MQVTGSWRPRLGQATWVHFRVGDRAVEARGIVVWATLCGDLCRWGIRFTALHRSSTDAIEAYVRHYIRQHGPVIEESPTRRWAVPDTAVYDGGPAIPVDEAEASIPIDLEFSEDTNTECTPLPAVLPVRTRAPRRTLIDLPPTYVGPVPSAVDKTEVASQDERLLAMYRAALEDLS